MKLHIFNPEHDLALAANQPVFTAPHAGRMLRSDLGYIPALWAEEGDLVLVDDIDNAYDKVRHIVGVNNINKVEFVTRLQLQKIFKDSTFIDSVHPWGWNLSLKHELLRMGCPEIMLPTDEGLDKLRSISSRQWAACHLQKDVVYVSDRVSLRQAIFHHERSVVKAPWSSSGRGIRYVTRDLDAGDAFWRWADNILEKQGGLTVEPYYNKVKDFGMEFVMKDGKAEYCGLSLFHTNKSAYTGNLLACEEAKMEMLGKYVSQDVLHNIKTHIAAKMSDTLKNVYNGPFGVDMMVCATKPGGDDLFVNSCVELNLRRTMGHVALSLTNDDDDPSRMMQVAYMNGRYHLNIRKL